MHVATRRIRRTIIAASSLVVLAAAAPWHEVRRHVKLLKSEPAAHDTIASPKALRLWYNEKVELKLSFVKLADAAGTPVVLAQSTRDETQERAPVVTMLAKPLAPGAYIVSWSAAAADGHPSKGTIDFVVKASK